jgi:hypothetical protein
MHGSDHGTEVNVTVEYTDDSCNESLQTAPLCKQLIHQFLDRKGMLEDTGHSCNGSLQTSLYKNNCQFLDRKGMTGWKWPQDIS